MEAKGLLSIKMPLIRLATFSLVPFRWGEGWLH